jgi:hypothetical protein
MNQFSLELELFSLLQQKIASACVTCERDWNIRQGYPIPSPEDLLVEAVHGQADETLADILRLSALVCADSLSLYQIDNVSDLEARARVIPELPVPSIASDLACAFTAIYDGIEEGDPPDPTACPFYYQDSYIG